MHEHVVHNNVDSEGPFDHSLSKHVSIVCNTRFKIKFITQPLFSVGNNTNEKYVRDSLLGYVM